MKPDKRDDLEPDSPQRDCPWKCPPDAKVCLCRDGAPRHRDWRAGKDPGSADDEGAKDEQ